MISETYIVNKDEIITIEYIDIFDNEIPPDYILINNKDTPDE